jgi:hypothetical protein
MKKTIIYILLPALLAAGCSRTDWENNSSKRVLFQVTAESPTRSTVSANGRFAWAEGDRIGVLNTRGELVPFDLVDGAGTATATFAYEGEEEFYAGEWAVFPYREYSWSFSDGNVSVDLPSSYYWDNGRTNSPMVAKIESGAGKQLNFKHIAGLIRCTITDIPEEANYLMLRTDNRRINGYFTVTNGVVETETCESKWDRIIQYYLDDVPRTGAVTFYVPVPVGDYEGMTFGLAYYDDFLGGGYSQHIDSPVHIDRADLRDAPEFTFRWQEKDLGEFTYSYYEDSWGGEMTIEEWLSFKPKQNSNYSSYSLPYQMAVIPLNSFNSTYGGDIGLLASDEESPFQEIWNDGGGYWLELNPLDRGVDYVAFSAQTDREGRFTGDYSKAVFSLGWAYWQFSSYRPSGSFLLYAPEGKLAKTMKTTKESDYLDTTDATIEGKALVLTSEATDLFDFEGSWYTEENSEEWFYLCKIRMPDGRLLVSRENSPQFFAVAGDSELADSQLWEVERQQDGGFLIRNYETSRYLQYNAQNGVFGLYDTQKGSLPLLLELYGKGAIGIRNE